MVNIIQLYNHYMGCYYFTMGVNNGKRSYFDIKTGIILPEYCFFQLFKQFSDDSVLLRGVGKIDDWCIYYGKGKPVSEAVEKSESFVNSPDIDDSCIPNQTMKVKRHIPQQENTKNELRFIVEGYGKDKSLRLFDIKPPRDVDYFRMLIRFKDDYGSDKVYSDYLKIYNRVTNKIDYSVFEDIECFSKTYGKDSLLVNKVFSILYVAMIAEETKNGGKLPLKKRVKRLGVHQVLIDGFSAERAARFSYGLNNDSVSLERVKKYVIEEQPALLDGVPEADIDSFKTETRFWKVLDFLMKQKGF